MLSDFDFVRLKPDHSLKPFDCGKDEICEDLNDFFHNDAKAYLRQLLTVTYLFESTDVTVAFFSVLNDKITIDDSGKRSFFNRLSRRSKIPNEKRWLSYPAAKVARLGIHLPYQRQRIGIEVLDFIKMMFTEKNKTGCRYLTVDAYNDRKVIDFYLKNDFSFLTDSDHEDKTRLMYYDLMRWIYHP